MIAWRQLWPCGYHLPVLHYDEWCCQSCSFPETWGCGHRYCADAIGVIMFAVWAQLGAWSLLSRSISSPSIPAHCSRGARWRLYAFNTASYSTVAIECECSTTSTRCFMQKRKRDLIHWNRCLVRWCLSTVSYYCHSYDDFIKFFQLKESHILLHFATIPTGSIVAGV